MLTQQLALVVIVGLAAFRASRLIAFDTILDGPRHAFYRRFPPDDHYARHYRLSPAPGHKGTWQVGSKARRLSWLGRLVECPWCSSVWFCAAIVAVLAWHDSVPDPPLVWAASCSVAGICGKMAS